MFLFWNSGETIAIEHDEIKSEMLEACQEARNAG